MEPVPCTNCGGCRATTIFRECVFSMARRQEHGCLPCRKAGQHLCDPCGDCRKVCRSVKTLPVVDPT